MQTRLFSVVSILLLLAAACPAATLVRDGKPQAVVALPTQPNAFESLAANELISHVEKMSGVKLDTVTVDAAEVDGFLSSARQKRQVPVFIGRNVHARLEPKFAP